MKIASLVAAGCLFLMASCQPKEETPSRPNIVLILADDMGYSDLGSYGGEINTPNLDRLANNGVRFTQFYNAARCCPTRASLLTGLYPHQAGVGQMVYNNWGGAYQGYLNQQSVTLAEVLGEAGYKTLMSGKWHVGHEEESQWPTSRGFDRFYGIHIHVDSYYKVLEGCDVYLDGQLHTPATDDPVNDLHPDQEWYTTDVFTDYAIKFLDEESSPDQPFFLYLAYNAPHFPTEAPVEDIQKYQGQYLTGWDSLRTEKFRRMKDMGILSPDEVLSPSGNTRWDTLSSEVKKELDFRRSIYAAQIDRMDQNIGRLVEHLEEMGKLDNTLILFLSDNGCSAETGMFGMNWPEYQTHNFEEWYKLGGWSVSQGQAWANASNTPFRLYKKYTHEGGTATPFVAHWPAVIQEGGALNDRLGHIIDIMPTLCEIGGAEYPKDYQGQPITPAEGTSLAGIFRGETVEPHEALFWSHMGNNAVRQGNWKLVKTHEDPWALYDMSQNRSETQNLATEFPERVDAMKTLYNNWAQKCGVREWPIESSDM